jgi:hypothetical protein
MTPNRITLEFDFNACSRRERDCPYPAQILHAIIFSAEIAAMNTTIKIR